MAAVRTALAPTPDHPPQCLADPCIPPGIPTPPNPGEMPPPNLPPPPDPDTGSPGPDDPDLADPDMDEPPDPAQMPDRQPGIPTGP